MPQKHGVQTGTFHITTNTKGGVPWLTLPGVPENIIDNLVMTKNVQRTELYAFCVLPDHVHLFISPGEKGLSAFMHSFKKNSSRDLSNLFDRSGFRTAAAIAMNRSGDSKIAACREGIIFTGWQKGFHDERIQSSKQREACLHYIQGNAMHHGLVSDVSDWPWTSFHFAQVLDPMEVWLD